MHLYAYCDSIRLTNCRFIISILKGNKMRAKLSALFTTLLLLLPIASDAAVYEVRARQNSTTGGFGVNVSSFFNVGDLITVTVNPNDLWSSGDRPRWSNADGQVDLFADGRRFDVADGPSRDRIPRRGRIGTDAFGQWTQGGLTANWGSLVGSWGDSTEFFFIGTNSSFNAEDTVLNLWYFDSNRFDNRGSIMANVTAVPEPETYALLLAGLGIVGYSARRRKN